MTKTSTVTTSFEGLGTRWVIELIGEFRHFPAPLRALILETVRQFDADYSRFKANSFVGRLNFEGRITKPPKALLDMFDFAAKMHKATDGAFDISIAAVLQNSGYGQLNTARQHTANFWNEVKYNRDEIVIPEGTSVDFGGFGKGWLVDILSVILEKQGYPYYVINGGGDLAVSAPEPIELGLEHPYDPSKVIGTTMLQKGGLAVSSIVKRRWLKGGKTHHHIIDPSTLAPSANGVVSTYVKGASSLVTDTIATVVLLRPELKDKLEKQFGVQIIIVTEDQL